MLERWRMRFVRCVIVKLNQISMRWSVRFVFLGYTKDARVFLERILIKFIPPSRNMGIMIGNVLLVRKVGLGEYLWELVLPPDS